MTQKKTTVNFCKLIGGDYLFNLLDIWYIY